MSAETYQKALLELASRQGYVTTTQLVALGEAAASAELDKGDGETQSIPPVMTAFFSEQRMRKARDTLGNPGDLNEAVVATGIDLFFYLLDGGYAVIDGRCLYLKEAPGVSHGDGV